jgi:OmpA-OmpF porin, OOP family
MDMLRRLLAATVIAAPALIGVTPASAQFAPYAAPEPAGPYIGGALGSQYLDNLSASGPLSGDTKLKYKWGPVGLGSLGYAFGNGFRAEVELGYRHNEAKSLEIPSGATLPSSLNLKTNAGATSYMVNGVYDFSLAPSWSANVGAGVGAAMIRINNVGNTSPFAYQAIAGVEYAIAPQTRLGVGYRFLGTESLHLGDSSLITSHAHYYDHAALVTLRYNFGAPPARPAVYVPPPPMPVPGAGATRPPPFSRNFEVYFATNSAVLGREAKATVDQAAAAAKDNAPAHIAIGGHTDTTGSQSYNQKLSERRADAVRKELVAQGVSADDIGTAGYGEDQLAVPTADNVKEPRNRRVIISMNGPGT